MTRKYKKHVTEAEIAAVVVEAALEAQRTLGGPGFLACVYQEALRFELAARGKSTERGLVVPLSYKSRRLTTTLPIDIVEKRVLVDCRASSEWSPLYEREMLKHLRLLDRSLGVVINFGTSPLLDGIRPVTNPVPELSRRTEAAERV